MKQWIMALTLGTAAAAGTAVAQDAMRPRGGGMGMMMRADTDGDGVISRAEYEAQANQRFARLDANGNGRIDEDEGFVGRRGGRGRRDRGPATLPPPVPADAAPGTAVSPPPPPRPSPAIGMTRDAYRDAAMARFDRIDANRDGRLDPAEVREGVRAAMSNRGAPPPAR